MLLNLIATFTKAKKQTTVNVLKLNPTITGCLAEFKPTITACLIPYITEEDTV